MYFETKLDREFLLKHASVTELLFSKLGFQSGWGIVRGTLDEDEQFEFLCDVIKDGDLPVLSFKVVMRDASFGHAFGTRHLKGPKLLDSSITLYVGIDSIDGGLLKGCLSVKDFDSLIDVANRTINNYEGSYE